MVSFDPFTAAIELGKTAIEKIWPDPTKQAEEMRKLEELKQSGDLAALNAHVQLMVAQIEVNKVAAEHPSLFVAGARPFIIWVGGFSLAYAGIIHPLLLWAWKAAQAFYPSIIGIDPPPYVESGTLGAIVSGLLGVGSMRSYDKSKGTQTNGVKK